VSGAGASEANRTISSPGLVPKASSAFTLRLRLASHTLRRTANSRTSASVRKLLEIFCLSFKGRISRSARLLVAGTGGLWRHRRVASRWWPKRRTQLWLGRRRRRSRSFWGKESRWLWSWRLYCTRWAKRFSIDYLSNYAFTVYYKNKKAIGWLFWVDLSRQMRW